MGQNIQIHPRISSGAPSVPALELKQNEISGGIKISHSNPIIMSFQMVKTITPTDNFLM